MLIQSSIHSGESKAFVKYYNFAKNLQARLYAKFNTNEYHKVDFDDEALSLFLPWLAFTYVLIEGWRDLKLEDYNVDLLLKSSNVDHLKLLRHDTFHFQKEFLPERTLVAFNRPEFILWLTSLNSEFTRFIDGGGLDKP